MQRVGRNDPCPCGSGKKYKHCCLRGQRAVASLSAAAREGPPTAVEMDGLRDLAEEAIRHASPKEAQELRAKWALVEDIAAYDAVSDEVEAAAQALEPHRAEFETLMQDVEATAKRAAELFAEDDFAPMCFSAEDVHRAFEAVGYPAQHPGDTEEPDKAYLAAMAFLADETYRGRVARRLLTLLPKYVAAGRYLDGWLIQMSSFRTLEAPLESNLFLFNMFWHGLEAWENAAQAGRETIMQELGLDPERVRNMSIPELLDWARQHMADPARRAQLEALAAAQPLSAGQTRAFGEELGRTMLHLLERDDARRLYLPAEEVEPWLSALTERSRPVVQEALAQSDAPSPESITQVQKIMLDVAREMALSVFTPQRLQRFVTELRAYSDDLQKADEREAALWAHAALLQLEQEEGPADNWFLVATCYASLYHLASEAARLGADVQAGD